MTTRLTISAGKCLPICLLCCFITAALIFYSCKKEKPVSSVVTPPPPPPPPPSPPPQGKTIKARVIEYGTDQPLAGAVMYVCTSPTGYYTCAGNYLSVTTGANGDCIFNADLFNFGWVEKAGYWQNIFQPCFVTYFRNDTLLNYNTDYTADSFIVKIVPKTDFTLHIIDSSLRGPLVGNYLTTDVNFNSCGIGGIIGVSLRRGIDTTIQFHSYYGNTAYVFTVGNDPDDGGFPINVLYQQQRYIANGNNITLNITY